MKRLLMLGFVVLLSLGIASVTLAQEAGATGGKAPAADTGTKTTKKHKKHAKKHKKGKQKEGQADEMKQADLPEGQRAACPSGLPMLTPCVPGDQSSSCVILSAERLAVATRPA